MITRGPRLVRILGPGKNRTSGIRTNVCLIKIRSKHSGNTLLRLLRTIVDQFI